MNSPQVNPELFKGEAPKELQSKIYYAYLDSIEKIYGTTFLRFDCIEKIKADEFEINSQSIVGFPSVVIDISAQNKTIDLLFGINGVFTIFNFESQWMVIKTSTQKSEISVTEFFNFVQVGNPQTFDTYTINSIQQENELDPSSSVKIKELKRATTLSESSSKEVQQFVEQIEVQTFSHVNVYNVGQGNCTALVDSSNLPLLYFDVGGGSGANKGTYPQNFRLCHSRQPRVILSHWDLDHIITAVFDADLLKTKWLVPLQSSVSNTAIQIALALQKKGNLICWNNSMSNEISNGSLIISKCSARANNKNNSGLALYVRYSKLKYVLLPGDASFKHIPNVQIRKLIGIIASHHGAKSSIQGMPSAKPPKMLVYSYGLNNTHGHAHIRARNEYINFNWGIGLDTINGSIAMIQKPVGIDVPCGSVNCSLSITQHF